MRNLIRRILREENEKTPKSKLIKQLEKPNGLITLLKGGFTIEDISDITEIPKKEIYQEFNPFKQIGEWFYDLFKEEIKNIINEYKGERSWTIKMYKDLVTKDEDKIIQFIISKAINAVRPYLIGVEDWKIPNTPKLLQIIYTDWIKEQKEYKELYDIIQNQ